MENSKKQSKNIVLEALVFKITEWQPGHEEKTNTHDLGQNGWLAEGWAWWGCLPSSIPTYDLVSLTPL